MTHPLHSRRGFLAQTAAATIMINADPTPTNAQVPTSPQQLKQKLLQCLGGPWPQPPDLKPLLQQSTRKQGYRLEYVSYDVEPHDRVSAYLLVPDGVNPNNPAPAIAVWHQHNGAYHLGKVEPAGLAGNPMHHTGVALALEGYVVLCPDALCFGERQHNRLKAGDYERWQFLRYVVSGKSLAWKNILDMRRAIDYLSQRPDVNPQRIGCYGHSMGSTHTWLVGPWEPRLKALVGNCCLPTYAAIHRTMILHCFPNFIPGLFQFADTPDIAGLIAPRRLHLNFGEKDAGSPIDEVKNAVNTIANAYQAAGAKDQFTWFIQHDADHELTPQMWQLAKDCFAKTLKA